MNTTSSSLSFSRPARGALFLLLLAPLLLQGCADDAPNLQSARTQTTNTLAQARAQESQLSHQLSTLPSTDPLRQSLQPQLDRLDQFITQAQSELPRLDAAIQSAQTSAQPLDPSIQQTISTIPYGSLAVALLGLTFAAIKHFQASSLLTQSQQSQKAFQQIVQALDSVLPTPTPIQQTTINAALDNDVKSQLAAARA